MENTQKSFNVFQKMEADLMVLLFFIVVFFIGNWLLDIGHVVVFSGGGYLTNGFWSFSALKAYHFGWYLAIISFVFVCLMYFNLMKRYLILSNKYKEVFDENN